MEGDTLYINHVSDFQLAAKARLESSEANFQQQALSLALHSQHNWMSTEVQPVLPQWHVKWYPTEGQDNKSTSLLTLNDPGTD